MNERIDELMIRAGARFDFLHGVHYDNFQYREFAKLIVRECAGIYNMIDNGNTHLGTDDYLEALQKHFGVE